MSYSGNSFDNNLLCIGEKALFVVESVADEVIRELQNSGGYLTNPRERASCRKCYHSERRPQHRLHR